jgi:hypothetical protein
MPSLATPLILSVVAPIWDSPLEGLSFVKASPVRSESS